MATDQAAETERRNIDSHRMSANVPLTGRSQRRRYTSRIANTIYSAVLLAMLYDWPYQIYQRLGPQMSEKSARERFIVREVETYADRLQLRVKPKFVVGSVPASAGAFSGNAVIVVSPAMLDQAMWSDNEVRFVLAHEVGHIARLDAYRFWTRWTERGAEGRESDADHIAVGLVGCRAMEETVARFWGEFMKGFQEKGDHHPHPNQRLRHACGKNTYTLPARAMPAGGRDTFREQKESSTRFTAAGDASAPALEPPARGGKGMVHVTALKDIDSAAPLPTLTVVGLDSSGVITGDTLTFRVEGLGSLDLVNDSDGLVLGPNGERITLRPYWVFRPEDHSFVIAGSNMRKLMDALPSGTLDISVNFVSADGEFAAVYEFLGTKSP